MRPHLYPSSPSKEGSLFFSPSHRSHLLLLRRHRRCLLLLLGPYEILVTVDSDPIVRPLASLLPHPFGPYDLLHKGAPRLPEPHHNELGAVEATKDNGIAGGGYHRTRHTMVAPSELAVTDEQGRVYAG
ncbi:hypothetical protein Cni_G13141 [Canna indica]|uniref:Uncharacterized protein n=1 Tax=Canna indica TaxID=4628 RepID=A0AAQ3K9K1_9LILI|nr:hypothetical protein Cni_G13141 [Canna indica]